MNWIRIALLGCLLLGCSEESGEATTGTTPVGSAAGDEVVETTLEPQPEPEPEPEPQNLEPAAPDASTPSSHSIGAELEPPEVVEACSQQFGEGEPRQRCLTESLDGRELRAREREQVIEAYEALGNESKAIEHMRLFLEDYPRDRRGNRYRLEVRRWDADNDAPE